MKLIRMHCHAGFREKLSECHLELHPEMVELLNEMGIIELQGETIHPEDIRRVNKILRLRKFFGLNLTGAAIVVDLLGQIEDMQDEIENLRKGRW